jgi:biopolymer transport protein ExbD
LNAAQVRAKARLAMKRREEEIEQEEMEGGELNLVPYLDIVTNVMLFLLATVTSGLLLGNINSALPQYSSSEGGSKGPADEQTEPPLQMSAWLTQEKIIFFSVSGLEGSFTAPVVEIQRKPTPSQAEIDRLKAANTPFQDYEYGKLTTAAAGIIEKRWKGKPPLSVDEKGEPACLDVGAKPLPKGSCRPKGATEVILVVDATIPYHVIISTMDALRQNTDKSIAYPDSVLFPDVIFGTGIK